MTNQKLNIDRVLQGSLGLYLVLMLPFNKGFSYLHLWIGKLPLFITEFILILLCGGLIYQYVKDKDLLQRSDAKLLLGFSLFWLVGMVALGRMVVGENVNFINSLKRAALFYYSAFGFLVYTLFDSKEKINDLMKWIYGGAVFTVFIEMIFILVQRPSGWPMSVGVAIVAADAICVYFGLLASVEKKHEKWVVFLASLAFVQIAFSGMRSGIINLVFAVGFVGLLFFGNKIPNENRKRFKPFLVWVLIIGAIFSLVLKQPSFLKRFSFLVGFLDFVKVEQVKLPAVSQKKIHESDLVKPSPVPVIKEKPNFNPKPAKKEVALVKEDPVPTPAPVKSEVAVVEEKPVPAPEPVKTEVAVVEEKPAPAPEPVKTEVVVVEEKPVPAPKPVKVEPVVIEEKSAPKPEPVKAKPVVVEKKPKVKDVPVKKKIVTPVVPEKKPELINPDYFFSNLSITKRLNEKVFSGSGNVLWRFIVWTEAIDQTILNNVFFGMGVHVPLIVTRLSPYTNPEKMRLAINQLEARYDFIDRLNSDENKPTDNVNPYLSYEFDRGPSEFFTPYWYDIDPHNSHVSVFFRFGLIGFLGYAILIFLTLIRLGKLMWKKDAVASILFLSLIWYLMAASFNVVLEGPFMGAVFWILMGLGLSYARLVKGNEDARYAN